MPGIFIHMHKLITDYEGLSNVLNTMVEGQQEAIDAIVPVVAGYFRGIRQNVPTPIGSFLLVGPTGVGKTSTAAALAYALHGNANKYISVDCTAYFDQFQVNRMIGPAPGFVGFGTTRPVIDQQRLIEHTSPACPVSIVLFDEIEKAHESMYNLLVGITGSGKLAAIGGKASEVSTHVSVEFNRTIILITTNIGSNLAVETAANRFHIASPGEGKVSIAKTLLEVKKQLPAELYKRLIVVPYRPLSREVLLSILERCLDELNLDLLQCNQPTRVVLTRKAVDYLLYRAEAEYGARAIKDVFDKEVYRMVVRMKKPVAGEYLHIDCVGPSLVCDYMKEGYKAA